jgi:Na+-driven multidrug efflux pump
MTTPAFRDPMLAGPIVPQILRLAAPSVTGLLAWTLSIVYDGWIIGQLGTAALAGAAMVLPLSMLMVQCSRAAMGGAIAGAVARAIGRGEADAARARAFHGVAIEAGIGLAFTLAGLLGGPSLYRLLGGEGEALAAAEAYALPIFGGAVATWVLNALGGVVSGAGNLRLPAATMVAGSLAHLLLCPALVFGWGPLPVMGVAGAGDRKSTRLNSSH